MKPLFLFTCLWVTVSLQAQNVSINNTGAAAHPSAQLDVQSTNKGVLLPQVALLDFFSPAPISSPAAGLLVYNTNTIGNLGQGITPGYYFWTGVQWQRLSSEVAWQNGGNALSAPGVFGSATNNPIDILMNSAIRGRLTSAGEFHWGATATTNVGDLMTATANASFPFALNGYSSFNGAGVYGAVLGGNTQFAGVQGEYASTTAGIFNTAGVRGLNQSGAAGTGFRTQSSTGPRVGVIGNTTVTNGQYTFGLHGTMGSTDIRCGGVIGDDFGIALGALAYFAANLADYSVYGFGNAFQAGVIAGRQAPGQRLLTESNTHIGLGIYGGVMGGWMRGLVYGTHVKGERYSLYVDGAGITNQPMAELVDNGQGARQAWYGTASTQAMVQAQGKLQFQGDVAELLFDASFQRMIGNQSEQLVVTLTPVGSPAQLYLESVTSKGFRVKRSDGQTGSVQVNWIAVAPRAQQPLPLSNELLSNDFDQRMNRVMFNDNNQVDQPGYLWWDGSQIRFDQPPPKKANPDATIGSRLASQ